ncbi:MAG: prolipoprotein diacylglyceryl transferase [Propionibacteriaceae bacterium]|jgi:prolipoprotein diacylglyceryl transferase|nr:prolipoprotein diacylglyceryl transferase [Propionibacteriaceae bacterium]
MFALFIPSPPWSSIHLGPFTIHIYALCLLAAIGVAWFWGKRRMVSWGGDADTFDSLAFTAIICGIVGARIYHVVTEWQRYFTAGRDWLDIFRIWNGGLGIIGAVIGGAIGAWVFCRIHHLDMAAVMDVFAPTLLAAQAVGRLGNWFNQEVFGSPTELPWGLEIDAIHRPFGYGEYATFHPTFLYEGLWNLFGILVLFLLSRGNNFGYGKLFTSYVLWYTFGRFFIELIRIDPVNAPAGIRVNNWATAAIFLVAALVLIWQLIKRPGADPAPFAPIAPTADASDVSDTSDASDTSDGLDTSDTSDTPDDSDTSDTGHDEVDAATFSDVSTD